MKELSHPPPLAEFVSTTPTNSAGRVLKLLRLVAIGSSLFAIVAGAAALVAECLQTGVLSGAVPTSAALGFIFSGLGLLAVLQPNWPKLQFKILCFVSTALALLATSTWAETAGLGSGLDDAPVPTQIPLCFALLSGGLWCAVAKRARVSEFGQYIAIVIGSLSTLALIRFAYDYVWVSSVGFTRALSFPCALALLALSISLFLARLEHGPASIFASPTLGGVVARRLLPICLLTPLLGLIGKLEGSQSTTLLIMILLVTFGLPLLIWTVASALGRAEEEKDRAYTQVNLLNQELNKQVDELMRSQQQISEALKARSEFLAKVSHELRTPLSGMIGTTELLLGMPLTAEQRELTNIALESANSLLGLINEILDFSKIDARKLHIECIPFDLHLAIETAVYSMRAKANKKHLTLMTFIAPDVPVKVQGDPGRLRQIMINLIDNAVKFTESGKVLIQIAVDHDDRPLVRFSVTDTGIGISSEQSERLFQPFVQADGSTTRRYGGTGLGLSICKSLVDLMSGKIGLLSSPGKGSTFWFALPLEDVSDTEPEYVEPVEMQKITTSAKTSVILLAEDNPVNARLAVLQLKRLGYQADVAGTGREAVDAVAKRQYALVLMDIQMPDMDGFEATNAIRKAEILNGLHVPIVATTAHAMPGDREKCIAAGMDDYLTKPLALEALAAILRKWTNPLLDECSEFTSVQANDHAVAGAATALTAANDEITQELSGRQPKANYREVLPFPKKRI